MAIRTTKRASYWVVGLYHLLGAWMGIYAYFFNNYQSIDEYQPISLLVFCSILLLAGFIIILKTKHGVFFNKTVLILQIPVFLAFNFTYLFSANYFILIGGGLVNFETKFGTTVFFGHDNSEFIDNIIFIGVNLTAVILFLYLWIDHKKFRKLLESRKVVHKIGEIPSDETIKNRINQMYD